MTGFGDCHVAGGHTFEPLLKLSKLSAVTEINKDALSA